MYEIVKALYDIGFDYPETHVIRKDGVLHYAFFTHENAAPVREVELRGLEAGRSYRLTDYYNHADLGVVTAGEKTILPVPVEGALLVEAVEVQ